MNTDGNPNAPHKVVIHVLVEVHEVTPQGQCKGSPVHKDRKVLVINGEDRYMAIRKSNELIQELQKTCQ